MDDALGRAQDLLIGDALQSFGAEIAPGGFAVITDANLAKNCIISSNLIFVAVLTLSASAPVFANNRFPTLQLIELVKKQSAMGQIERCAFSAAAGNQLPVRLNIIELISHLKKTIRHYGLSRFFAGYSYRNGIMVTRPDGRSLQVRVKEWQNQYDNLSETRKIFVATILWLNCETCDPFWIEDLQHEWSAVTAITALKEAGALKDWAKLVALWVNYESPYKYA